MADTNILISGTIVEQGASAKVVDAARRGRIRLVVSPLLLEEYVEVIKRPHIADKYQEITARVDVIVNFLRVHALMVAGVPKERVVLDDPDDDAVIACALEGNAEYIVSGDPHLKALGEYKGIKIVTAKELVTILNL
ncbi:MAG: putative toxin-antitoxin system toxin component, PIN family [Anaerolineae bacterium]